MPANNLDIPVPTNIDAEQALLGSLLLDPYAFERVLSLVEARDFYRETHQWIFEAALSLYGVQSPIDIISLSDELKRQGRLVPAGGLSYLTTLISIPPTSVHAEHYATLVADKGRRRRIIQAGSDICKIAYDETLDMDAVLDRTESRIMDVTARTRLEGLQPLGPALLDMYTRYQDLMTHREACIGVPCGIPELDEALGGFQKSDLVLVAARPGLGKTSLLLGAALHAAMRGHPVAIFSLEMNRLQVVQRLISMVTGVDLHRLRMARTTDQETDKIAQAMGEIDRLPILVDDTPGISVLQLRANARRAHARRPLDLILVDYIQLMATGDRRMDNRVQEITRISQGLKTLARELDTPVVSASQLSRAVENRQEKKPMLSDLRDSGSLEQDADVVIGLYRDAYYSHPTHPPEVEVAEAIVLKHRNGPTGTHEIGFIRRQARYVGYAAATIKERSAA